AVGAEIAENLPLVHAQVEVDDTACSPVGLCEMVCLDDGHSFLHEIRRPYVVFRLYIMPRVYRSEPPRKYREVLGRLASLTSGVLRRNTNQPARRGRRADLCQAYVGQVAITDVDVRCRCSGSGRR